MSLFFFICIMVLILTLLILVSGWFSGLETAITNISIGEIADMMKNKEKFAKYVFLLKKDMNRTLIAILIGNNVINILLASLAALFADIVFHTFGVTLVIIIITFLTIVFGDIIPKSRGIVDDKLICSRRAKILYVFKKSIAWLILFFIIISKNYIKRFTTTSSTKIRLVGDQSIKNLTSLSQQQGNIKAIEKEIIDHVFFFGDKKVHDIMVPVEKIFYLDKNYSLDEARKIMVLHGFSRVPCINKKREIIGILYSKDLLKSTNKPISSLLKPPFFVSADDDISEIFILMKKKRVHFALVLDKNERHVGLIALEDILEELVGEIYDEFYENKFKNNNKK